MAGRQLFSSESVGKGHPDKVADQISDAVLDAILAEDPKGHVACETLVTTGLVVVAGEIRTAAYVDIPRVVRETVREIGYDRPEYFFDSESCGVVTAIDEQSGDIAQGVDRPDPLEQGAGDQGIMFGYASDETPELMPLPIVLAHRIVKRIEDVRRSGELAWLGPDCKSQVTIEYEDDRPVRIDTVVCAAQHAAEIDEEEVRAQIERVVINPVLPAELISKRPRMLINQTGRFVKGGPAADAGVTGRKIIVDTYGGMARHGGGAFSGKDPSKVDRSAAYAARWVALNIVGAGMAKRCEIQLAYCIGYAQPLSIHVEAFGTGRVPDARMVEAVRSAFDLRPGAIIRDLDLLRPIYRKTASYGHFGRREPEFTWERLDRVDALKKFL
jgi:S-adenosylmethionine synthetase